MDQLNAIIDSLIKCNFKKIKRIRFNNQANENLFDIDFIFGSIKWGLNFIGIWPTTNNRSSNVKCAVAATIIFICSFLPCFIVMCTASNTEIFIEASTYAVVFSTLLLKLLICKVMQKKLSVLLTTMEINFARYRLLSISRRTIIVRNVKRRKFVTVMLILTINLSIAAYVLQLYNFSTKKFEFHLMKDYIPSFPDALNNSLVFLLARTIYIYILLWLMIIIIASIDSLYVICMIHACDEFTIILDKLEKLDRLNFSRCNQGNEIFLCNCIKCIVRHHIAVIKLIKDIESIFHPIIFLQLIMVSTQLMIQIHNFIWYYKISNILKFIHVIIMLLSINLNFLQYCIPAKNITQSGYKVGYHAYQLNWHNYHPSTIRSIMLLILRSQTPCFVTAAKFVQLSLETYTVIVKTSVSYASVILALRGKSQNILQ